MEELYTNIELNEETPLKKLYNGLYSDKKYTKSFDEFKIKFSKPESIKSLYSGLKEDGDYTKSEEEFNKQYFSDVKKKASTQSLPSVSQDYAYGSKAFQPNTLGTNEENFTMKGVVKEAPKKNPVLEFKETKKDKLNPLVGNDISTLLPKENKEEIVSYVNKDFEANQRMSDRLNAIDIAYDGDVKEINRAKSFPTEQGVITTKIEDKDRDGNRALYTYNKILNGVGSLVNTLGDVGATIMAYSPNKGYSYNGDIKPRTKEEIESQRQILTDYRKNVANDVRNYFRDNLGADVDKGLEARYDNEFLTSAIGGLAESAPAMFVPAPLRGVAMIAQGYDSGLRSVESADVNGEVDDLTKSIYAITVGTANGLLEKVGFDKIFGAGTSKLAEQVTKKAIKESVETTEGKVTSDVLTKFLESNIKDIANKYTKGGVDAVGKVLSGGAVEFATGATQEGATIGAEFLLNKATGKPIFDPKSFENFSDIAMRIAYSGAQEAVGGGLLGGVSHLISKSKGFKSRPLDKVQADLENINDALETPELSETSKEVLVKRKIELQNEYNDSVKEAERVYEELDGKQKEDFDNIVSEKIKLDEVINDPAVDDSIKKDLEKQSKELDGRLSEIKPLEEVKIESNTKAPTEMVASSEIIREPKIGDEVGYNLNNESFTGVLKEIKENGDYIIEKPDGYLYTTNALETIKSKENESENVGIREKRKEIDNTSILKKAEDDLAMLKKVDNKSVKYEASMKRLSNAKSQGLITEKEFNSFKERFDDVIAETTPSVVADNKKVDIIPETFNKKTSELNDKEVEYEIEAIERILSDNTIALDKNIVTGSNQFKTSPKVKEYIGKVEPILKAIFPDIKLNTYKSIDEYVEAEGRNRMSAGVYNREKNSIGLNLELIEKHNAEYTVFHEAIHPVVDAVFYGNKKLLDNAIEKIKSLKDVEGINKVYEHAELYAGLDKETRQIEAITEFLTQVADNGINVKSLPSSSFTKVKEVFNYILEQLGIDYRLSTAEDIVSLSRAIKESFETKDPTALSKILHGKDLSSKFGKEADILSRAELENRLKELKKIKEEKQNAIEIGKIEQSSESERKGTSGQQQGKQENREHKKEPIIETKTETGGSDSAKQSGEKQKVDIDDNGISGIKKKLVSDEIIESVDLDKISDKEMHKVGEKLVDTGEIDPKSIVDSIAGVSTKSILGGEKRVGGENRALQPKEVVALIYYKTKLDNSLREALIERNKIFEQGKSTSELDVKIANIENDIISYDVMSVITAQQQSLAFRLRQGLRDRDYNLVEQVERYKKDNKGVIPDNVLAKFKELDRELKEIKDKKAELELKVKEQEEKLAIESIIKDIARENAPKGNKLERAKAELKEAKESFSNFLKKNRGQLNSGADVAGFVKEATKLIKAYSKLGIVKAEDVFREIAKDYGSKFLKDNKDLLQEAYDESSKISTSDKNRPFIKDGELVVPNNYIRELVKQGVTDINELSSKVKDFISEELPDATLRQVRDAITKYGKEVNQTADDITRSINEAKRLGKLYSKLEDVQNGIKKESNIKKYNNLTAEERGLKKQIKLIEDRLPKTNDEINKAEQDRIDRAIKATERSIEKIKERISDGELEVKVNKTPETTELKDARDRLKIESEKLKELQKEAGILEKNKVEAKKRYYEKYIKEKQRRLDEKDFSAKEKTNKLLGDSELQSLEAEANRIRSEYDEAHYENQQKNRETSTKIKDAVIDWGSGLQRALTAGLDGSAFGVQGIIAITTQNPAKTIEAVKESAKFLASEKYSRGFFDRLKAEPDYPKMKASGLALNEHNPKHGSFDSQVSGSVVNKIWDFTTYPTKLIFGEKAYDKVKLFNPYRSTERAFTGAIDTLRVQMFREFSNVLEQQGITFESNPEMYKTAANAVNNMTFRGRLRNLEGVSRELSVVFFAPRKVAATLSLTNPYYYADLYSKNPIVAKRVLLKMATFIGLSFTLATAIKTLRDDDDEEYDSNPDLFNPYSADFMKAKIGNTRLDFFGGLNQNVVLYSRVLSDPINRLLLGKSGYYKSTSKHENEFMGENRNPTLGKIIGTFSTNKFAPSFGLMYKYLTQEKGDMMDWEDESINNVTPMWTQSIKELYKEHPNEMATFFTAMAVFGQSMSTYGGADFLDKDKDAEIKNFFLKKGVSFRKENKNNIEILDVNTAEKRTLDKKEFENYEKEYGDYIKGEVKYRFDELNKMDINKFESEMKKIKNKAKEYAKASTFNTYDNIDVIESGDKIYELSKSQIKDRASIIRDYLKEDGKDLLEDYEDKFIEDGMPKSIAKKKAFVEVLKKANAFSKIQMIEDDRDKNDGEISFKEKK